MARECDVPNCERHLSDGIQTDFKKGKENEKYACSACYAAWGKSMNYGVFGNDLLKNRHLYLVAP